MSADADRSEVVSSVALTSSREGLPFDLDIGGEKFQHWSSPEMVSRCNF